MTAEQGPVDGRTPRVLLIGFTADAADPDAASADLHRLRAALDAGDAAVIAAGYEVTHAWIGTDHAAGVDGARRALTAGRFDVVLIGGGVRGHVQFTDLFEQLVNLVHELAPSSRFAFNTDPPSTLDAVRRNAPDPGRTP